MPRPLVPYRSLIGDNARWENFRFRAGDILICTPPKCGTTWTQMLCALLIFQTPELPAPLDQISPWLDQLVRPLDSVVADLEAQRHRRFIKTHTPLDGLPFVPEVTYIAIARDPRDAFLSLDNHLANLDWEKVAALRQATVGRDELPELMPNGLPAPVGTERDRFWRWVEEAAPGRVASGLAAMLHHLESYFAARHEPNVLLLHYGDLKEDLEGEMRRLSGRLGIEVPEERWPALVRVASFDEMKRRARETGPNQTECLWKDHQRFFHRARHGEWRDLLDEQDLQRYAAAVRKLAEPDLAAWVHRGPL